VIEKWSLFEWLPVKAANVFERKNLLHLVSEFVYEKLRGALHPLKFKKNDGFHLALRWIDPP